MTCEEIKKLKQTTFPHLTSNDVRISLSDREIVNRELDLTTDSVLTDGDKPEIREFFYQHRSCLSTHGQSGYCTKYTAKLRPVNLKPFYIRPYLTHEKEIAFAEKEMAKLAQLGVLERGSSEFLSPIMLIPKSHSGEKLSSDPNFRLLADYRWLNSHLEDTKFSYPELKYVLNRIGKSKAKVFSCLDLKNAFYSIPLDAESKQYTAVCASPGSPTYLYKTLPQGLKQSPAFFQNLVNDLIQEIPEDLRQYITSIMDDTLIYTEDVKTHKKVLSAFLTKLKDYGFLLTLNKIHCFRNKVKYMGLELSNLNGIPMIKPLGSRVNSILSLPIPKTVRGIKSFVGSVLFISQFLKDLSVYVKPLLQLTRKCNHLHKLPKIAPASEYRSGKGRSKFKSPDISSLWTQEHTDNFLKIKNLISNVPCLVLPNTKDMFTLECDSSKTSCGAVLYQYQNGKDRIVAFYSSAMRESKTLGSTELEITGLVKCIEHFQYLLKYNKFRVLVDHAALKRIYCSKKQPATSRIQRSLEKLSKYNFEIAHVSGSKMFISDFLSRNSDQNCANEPIPFITFDMNEVLSCANYMEMIDQECKDTNCETSSKSNSELCYHAYPLGIMTRSQYRKHKVEVPELFAPLEEKRKTKDQPQHIPNVQGDKPLTNKNTQRKRQNVKSKANSRKRNALCQNPNTGRDTEQIENVNEIVTVNDITPVGSKQTRLRNVETDNLDYEMLQQAQNKAKLEETTAINEIRSAQNGQQTLAKTLHQQMHPQTDHNDLIPEVTEESTSDIKRYFQQPKPILQDSTDQVKLKSRKSLPTQEMINKMLDTLNHKCKHFYKLPFEVSELRQKQREDPFFKSIISYLENDILPKQSDAQRSIIAQSEHYIMFSDILFRVTHRNKDQLGSKFALCIPQSLSTHLFEQYHSGLLSSHQGLTRTFYKIRADFYVRNLYNLLYDYVMSCRVCSQRRNIPFNEKQRNWAENYIHDFVPMTEISMDIKVMPQSSRGFHYLLVTRCNHSRYIITDALKDRKATTVVESLFQMIFYVHESNYSSGKSISDDFLCAWHCENDLL